MLKLVRKSGPNLMRLHGNHRAFYYSFPSATFLSFVQLSPTLHHHRDNALFH
ncbi:hypothetical protein BO86DRAFT_154163 [Aspergillus japonicus CBS 114.51]|uniref:Uncharacterized protein n=1 Tax=Aspergillus japonicus CBS 114.51 TaxID=1448312 RepID=A0A8T8WUR8_ASPJA|nr:hypothetical protein BO86DRAFT_154163 [Aspergillus japonicus CBS 114.51]RAH79410.1 hypothetical protein BO86DRAFT_154163 [Aspergillus japonicus CBS 114.51]